MANNTRITAPAEVRFSYWYHCADKHIISGLVLEKKKILTEEKEKSLGYVTQH